MTVASQPTTDLMVKLQPDLNAEEIEGLGDIQEESWRDQPLDEILIRRESRTINEILHQISENGYIMNPDLQRDFVWDQKKQSRLIESIIMRIPLPVFYLAEDREGRTIIVDGLQRISTFKCFANNNLKLILPGRAELDGKRFEDLAPKLQNRIENCDLILYIIDERAPEQARLDIFERVNSGMRLTRQQMRNCLYTGEATRFLRSEANNDLFLNATGRSLNPQTMRDREFVNRFCAFQLLPLTDYRNVDQFLAKGLKRINQKPGLLTDLSLKFGTSLGNNLRLFGKHAFRRHTPNQKERNKISAPLWDVMSTTMSRYSESTVALYADQFRESFYQLLDEERFLQAITNGPNNPENVKYRFSAIRKILSEVIGAQPS